MEAPKSDKTDPQEPNPTVSEHLSSDEPQPLPNIRTEPEELIAETPDDPPVIEFADLAPHPIELAMSQPAFTSTQDTSAADVFDAPLQPVANPMLAGPTPLTHCIRGSTLTDVMDAPLMSLMDAAALLEAYPAHRLRQKHQKQQDRARAAVMLPESVRRAQLRTTRSKEPVLSSFTLIEGPPPGPVMVKPSADAWRATKRHTADIEDVEA